MFSPSSAPPASEKTSSSSSAAAAGQSAEAQKRMGILVNGSGPLEVPTAPFVSPYSLFPVPCNFPAFAGEFQDPEAQQNQQQQQQQAQQAQLIKSFPYYYFLNGAAETAALSKNPSFASHLIPLMALNHQTAQPAQPSALQIPQNLQHSQPPSSSHRVRFSVPSAPSFDDVRRSRHLKTPLQMRVLKNFFQINQKPSKEQMKRMMKETTCSYSEICRWFRNERHKEKKANKLKAGGSGRASVHSESPEEFSTNSESEAEGENSGTPENAPVPQDECDVARAPDDVEHPEKPSASEFSPIAGWLAAFAAFSPAVQEAALKALERQRPPKRERSNGAGEERRESSKSIKIENKEK